MTKPVTKLPGIRDLGRAAPQSHKRSLGSLEKHFRTIIKLISHEIRHRAPAPSPTAIMLRLLAGAFRGL